MRKTAIVACLSMLGTALAAQTSTTEKFANQSDRGLKVMVLPPSPETHEPLRYRLSEPAYVAAFMVYPGSGVRLLYPQVDAPERLQRAGYNVGWLPMSFDNDAYRAILGPTQNGPAYLYVIASRHPLDVARYVNRPARLASTIGWNETRSFYSSVAFDGIVNNAVSLGDDQSWDADVYTIWPQDAADRQRSAAQRGSPWSGGYRLIVCADGNARAVPYNYPFTGCSGDVRVRAKVPALKPVVQQTASAAPPQTAAPSAAASTAVALANSGAAPSMGIGAAAPTVLPTIIGKRLAEPDRGGLASQAAVSKPVVYTMANGDQSTPAPSVTVAPGIRIERMDAGYARSRSADRTDVDGRTRDRRHAVEQDGQPVGRSPRLSPNPQLAPNPKLSPNPDVSPAPPRVAAPRNEAEQRTRRESMRVPPAPPSQPHEPREAPPTAKP